MKSAWEGVTFSTELRNETCEESCGIAQQEVDDYSSKKFDKRELKQRLTPIQYKVTQLQQTEK